MRKLARANQKVQNLSGFHDLTLNTFTQEKDVSGTRS